MAPCQRSSTAKRVQSLKTRGTVLAAETSAPDLPSLPREPSEPTEDWPQCLPLAPQTAAQQTELDRGSGGDEKGE